MSARASRTQVQKYFPACPFCLENLVEVHHDHTSRDLALCKSCGTLWHIYISQLTFDMKWAQLIETQAKEGTTLFGIKHKPEFWRDLSLKNSFKKKQVQSKTELVNHPTVTEIIKEKQVIIKIRCPYCHKTYEETLDKCPNCGA